MFWWQRKFGDSTVKGLPQAKFAWKLQCNIKKSSYFIVYKSCAISVYYSIIAKLIVQTLSRSVFCAELPFLCPVSYALRETNKGNYLSAPSSLSPLACSFINPAQCPTPLTLPLPFTFGAPPPVLDYKFCELQPTSCFLHVASCALCVWDAGSIWSLELKADVLLGSSYHNTCCHSRLQMFSRKEAILDERIKGMCGGAGEEKKKKAKKYPIFREGFTLVKISGLILLNWVFPLFTGF